MFGLSGDFALEERVSMVRALVSDPPVLSRSAATNSSSVGLLYSDTCRKPCACYSAIPVVRVPSHQQPYCTGKLPSARKSP